MLSNSLRKESAAGLVILLVCSAFASALVIDSYDTVFVSQAGFAGGQVLMRMVCPVIHGAMGPGDTRECRVLLGYNPTRQAYNFVVQSCESGSGYWRDVDDVLIEPLPDDYIVQSVKSAYMQALASDDTILRDAKTLWLEQIAGYDYDKPLALANSPDSIMDMSILLADDDGDGVMNLADADFTFAVPEPGSLFAFAGGWLLLRRKCKHGAA